MRAKFWLENVKKGRDLGNHAMCGWERQLGMLRDGLDSSGSSALGTDFTI
jgi:hypothetical protein